MNSFLVYFEKFYCGCHGDHVDTKFDHHDVNFDVPCLSVLCIFVFVFVLAHPEPASVDM
jgi:hypothetical protein